MRWQIEPLIGLGPLKFGMTRADVAAILDPLHAIDNFFDAYGGGKREFRGLALPSISYVGDETKGFAATEFEVGWRVKDVYLDDFEIFDHPSRDVLRYLEYRNGGALAGLGFVLFDGIGLNSGGFYDEQSNTFFDVRSGKQDERTITVCQKGAFNRFLDQFRKISFGAD